MTAVLRIISSPFKGEVGRGMGYEVVFSATPIPILTFPLKGKELTLATELDLFEAAKWRS